MIFSCWKATKSESFHPAVFCVECAFQEGRHRPGMLLLGELPLRFEFWTACPCSSVRWPCVVKRCSCRSRRIELWGVQQCLLLFLLLWHTPGKSSGRKGCLGSYCVDTVCHSGVRVPCSKNSRQLVTLQLWSGSSKMDTGAQLTFSFLLSPRPHPWEGATHVQDGSPPKLAQSRNSLWPFRGLPSRWLWILSSWRCIRLRVQLRGRTFAWTLGSLLSFTQKIMYFLIFSKFYLCERVWMCVWVCLETKKGIPGAGILGSCQLPMWVLGTKLRSS